MRPGKQHKIKALRKKIHNIYIVFVFSIPLRKETYSFIIEFLVLDLFEKILARDLINIRNNILVKGS